LEKRQPYPNSKNGVVLVSYQNKREGEKKETLTGEASDIENMVTPRCIISRGPGPVSNVSTSASGYGVVFNSSTRPAGTPRTICMTKDARTPMTILADFQCEGTRFGYKIDELTPLIACA
jgi:hypothetical protein